MAVIPQNRPEICGNGDIVARILQIKLRLAGIVRGRNLLLWEMSGVRVENVQPYGFLVLNS